MIIIANYNKTNKKWLPMVNIIDDIEKTKKSIKIQIIDQIINDPTSLKAYKTLEVYKVGEVDEELNITKTEKEKIVSYEDLLKEIIEDLTKEKYYEKLK